MKTFQLPALLESFRTMADRGIKIVFSTGELSPEQVANIHYAFQKVGYLAFRPDPFATAELEELEKLKIDFDDTGKSPSQRLRNVLFRNFEINPEGYKTFNDFYNAHMEKIINHYKKKLP